MDKKGKATSRIDNERVTRGQLIGRIARFVIVILVQVLIVRWAYVNMTAVDSIQIKQILVEGNFKYLDRADVEAYFMRNYNHYNLLTMDLNEVRSDIERLSWVKSVYLRKMLPDILVINIEEHVPIAYYNKGVLTKSGKVVYPELKLLKEDFIHLYGPDSRGEEVYREYLRMNDFLKSAGFTIGSVVLTNNFLWNVYLENGPVLYLGNSMDDLITDGESGALSGDNLLIKRLKRIAAAYPYLDNRAAIQYIDLRYQTGFAVKWRDESSDSTLSLDKTQPDTK